MDTNGLSQSEINEDDNVSLVPGGEWTRSVTVKLPLWAMKELDLEAERLGSTRSELGRTWLMEKIEGLRREVSY